MTRIHVNYANFLFVLETPAVSRRSLCFINDSTIRIRTNALINSDNISISRRYIIDRQILNGRQQKSNIVVIRQISR